MAWARCNKARDGRLDRTVAIKILPQALAGDEQFRERFDREARAISHLDHPHICALYDIGEDQGTAFLIMQYLEGETLENCLKKGPLPLDQGIKTALDGTMMAADVTLGKEVQAALPQALFPSTLLKGTDRHPYAVTKDGKPFLLRVADPRQISLPITVVLNWPALAKK